VLTGAERPAPHDAACASSFVAPAPRALVDALTLSVEATDLAGNLGGTDVPLWVGVPPQVTSLDPATGPAGGMTTLVVSGGTFISQGSGTRIFVDGVPALPASTPSDAGHLTGRTPPHEPGWAPVTVRIGSLDVPAGDFEYVAAPTVRAVDPPSGPPGGGAPIAVAGNHFRAGYTVISFVGRNGVPVPLEAPVWRGENRVDGLTPPGTGAVQVQAWDPVGGLGDLVAGYLYDEAAPPAPAPAPTADGGAP
jgi:hypothetical protein